MFVFVEVARRQADNTLDDLVVDNNEKHIISVYSHDFSLFFPLSNADGSFGLLLSYRESPYVLPRTCFFEMTTHSMFLVMMTDNYR